MVHLADTPSATHAMVHRFGSGLAEGGADMGRLLGNKGANLCELASIGLPVPPGFILTTEACAAWEKAGGELDDDVRAQVVDGMHWLEEGFAASGEGAMPLLVSVRSGAPVSMPGMMESVLDLGFRNAQHVDEVATSGTVDERLARDTWRRFLQMFGSVVLGVPAAEFDAALTMARTRDDVASDADLSSESLTDLALEFERIITATCGAGAIPEDPAEQLMLAIGAVFASWNGAPAKSYRALNDIPGDLGTAVNVQRMVYGNADASSGSGVLFTRNPASGEPRMFGEYLQCAQGEDVVSGVRTPQPISSVDAAPGQLSLQEVMPDSWATLQDDVAKLERHYRDVQDVEFTIERGELFLLQTRRAKRTAHASLRAAIDMVDEGLITRDEALLRVDAESLGQLLLPQFDPNAPRQVLARGIPASPGAASGRIVMNADDAVAWAARGERVILVRGETSASDIAGMAAAAGMVTARGGATSHAAVVARGMGTPCITGCVDLDLDEKTSTLRIGDVVLAEGDSVSVDGTTGELLKGAVPTVAATVDPNLDRLLGWASETGVLGVRANADVAADAQRAFALGARGIGLCRTEHMFFAPERLPHFTRAVLAETADERRAALEPLGAAIEADFQAMFEAMSGHPVTIRLLDPPLHEFLPHGEDDMKRMAASTGITLEQLEHATRRLHEENPMLGHRGVRLAITHPELCESVVRWIVRAATSALAAGFDPRPQVMLPVIASERELHAVRELVATTITRTLAELDAKPQDYPIGTMIEVPRACLLADRLAVDADFMSFGTNDLTQLTWGISRDDAGSFLNEYERRGLLDADPFAHLDIDGVGQLVQLAIERARTTRPGLEFGVCGEHGGDPHSIDAFHTYGVNYVSCSASRVPIALLASAQSALRAAAKASAATPD